MNVLIIGAGAIGCLVGGKLAQAGQSVTLVGRPRFAAAVAADGLQLTDEHGDHRIRTVTPAGSLAQAWTGAPFDLSILTVKSYDTAAAIAELSTVATGPQDFPILSLQNGVGNEDALAAAFGSQRIIAGTLTTPVSVRGPGDIRIDRPSYTLGLSPWDAGAPDQAVAAAHQALLDAGFQAKRYPHARGLKWTKLLMNMMANAACAITDLPPGQLMADAGAVSLEIAAWRETLAVMAASRIPPVNLGSYPFAWLAPLIRWGPDALLHRVLRQQVAGARGTKLPSLHLDLHGGKTRSEIGWLNGAVVRQGEQVGVATPVNRLLTDTLTQLMGDPQQQALWRGNLAKLTAAAQAAIRRG